MYRLVVFWLAATPVWGWGVAGHSIVARLAAARLTPSASAQVASLLGPGVTLASISSWADQIRNSRQETGPWHYIDIQITDPHLNMKRDCPEGNCVLAKLEEFERVLKDKNADPQKRKEALLFVVHFIGDMHQPLHCADNHDKGGNDVKLTFNGRPTNLHSVWDTGLISRMGTEDQIFEELDKDLSPKRTRKLAKGKLSQWAEESHRQAQVTVYGKLPPVEKGVTAPVPQSYQDASIPVVKEQLERAGARLARVLNETLR